MFWLSSSRPEQGGSESSLRVFFFYFYRLLELYDYMLATNMTQTAILTLDWDPTNSKLIWVLNDS
jgi:hypothetical protein